VTEYRLLRYVQMIPRRFHIFHSVTLSRSIRCLRFSTIALSLASRRIFATLLDRSFSVVLRFMHYVSRPCPRLMSSNRTFRQLKTATYTHYPLGSPVLTTLP